MLLGEKSTQVGEISEVLSSSRYKVSWKGRSVTAHLYTGEKLKKGTWVIFTLANDRRYHILGKRKKSTLNTEEVRVDG